MSTISINSISVYSIYDAAAEEYGPPFLAKTDAVAFRMYNQLREREQVTSKDYELFRIGSYDNSTGSLGSIEPQKIDIVDKIKGVFGDKQISEVK